MHSPAERLEFSPNQVRVFGNERLEAVTADNLPTVESIRLLFGAIQTLAPNDGGNVDSVCTNAGELLQREVGKLTGPIHHDAREPRFWIPRRTPKHTSIHIGYKPNSANTELDAANVGSPSADIGLMFQDRWVAIPRPGYPTWGYLTVDEVLSLKLNPESAMLLRIITRVRPEVRNWEKQGLRQYKTFTAEKPATLSEVMTAHRGLLNALEFEGHHINQETSRAWHNLK